MTAQEKTLRKLAHGKVNDAVLLAFHPELDADQIAALDLCNVSEITHDKGRQITSIKFYDRFEALERLTLGERRKEATSLYEALGAGAASVKWDEE